MAVLEKTAINGMNRHISECFLALCKKHGASGQIDFQLSDLPTAEGRTTGRRYNVTERLGEDDAHVPELVTVTTKRTKMNEASFQFDMRGTCEHRKYLRSFNIAFKKIPLGTKIDEKDDSEDAEDKILSNNRFEM